MKRWLILALLLVMSSISANGGSMEINISHRVTLFPQPTNMSCWSAAATMLFGNLSVDSGGATTWPTGGLESNFSNIQTFSSAHGLQMHAPQSWTIDGIAKLLRQGPLWIGGDTPLGHAYVIAAMNGDGTPNNTTITIYDPWPPKIGKIQRVSYYKWMRSYPTATMYILHR